MKVMGRLNHFPSRLAVAVLVSAASATTAVITHSILDQQPTPPISLPTLPNSEVKLDAIAAIGYLEPKGEVIQVSAPAFSEGARVDQLLV